MPVQVDSHFLLDWARDLGSTYPFFDFHIHPYDVMAGNTAYQVNNQVDGLFSAGLSAYQPPTLDSKIEISTESATFQKAVETERALLLTSRYIYTHTGSRVVTDQISLVGISNALLLPVVRAPGAATEMLEKTKEMFSNHPRLLLGCPFPIGLERDELAHFFCTAREKWDVQAIKIHPNLANIDPSSETGQDLIEATLEVAGSLGLPVVVHGGRTPGLKPVEMGEYGILSHLKEIDWSISSAPVIIAHAGCYGLTEEEATADISILEKMLCKSSNLFADISNLTFPVLKLVLEEIDHKRLIFGSDALYVPVWKAWIMFLQALREQSPYPEKDLICMASENPSRCVKTAIVEQIS